MVTTMRVEIAYSSETQQQLHTLELPLGSRVRDAIQQSGLLACCPELTWETLLVGIFSRRCDLDTVVQPGDRVEIYRPLQTDPKERRRQRAQHL